MPQSQKRRFIVGQINQSRREKLASQEGIARAGNDVQMRGQDFNKEVGMRGHDVSAQGNQLSADTTMRGQDMDMKQHEGRMDLGQDKLGLLQQQHKDSHGLAQERLGADVAHQRRTSGQQDWQQRFQERQHGDVMDQRSQAAELARQGLNLRGLTATQPGLDQWGSSTGKVPAPLVLNEAGEWVSDESEDEVLQRLIDEARGRRQ